jgi:hypothetical protein
MKSGFKCPPRLAEPALVRRATRWPAVLIPGLESPTALCSGLNTCPMGPILAQNRNPGTRFGMASILLKPAAFRDFNSSWVVVSPDVEGECWNLQLQAY